MQSVKSLFAFVKKAPLWVWALLAGLIMGERWRRTRALQEIAKTNSVAKNAEAARQDADHRAGEKQKENDRNARDAHEKRESKIEDGARAIQTDNLDNLAGFVNDAFDD